MPAAELPRPWGHDWAGRLHEHVFDSEALTGNPLGDPHRRPLWIYTPPGYDDDPARRYPSIYLIQGMTGQVDMWRNRKAFSPSVVESIDAWFAGSDATISLTRGFQDHFLLLVVPPGTAPETAASAMARASATGNHTPAAELLLG